MYYNSFPNQTLSGLDGDDVWINGYKTGPGTTWKYFDDGASFELSYTNWVDEGYDVSIKYVYIDDQCTFKDRVGSPSNQDLEPNSHQKKKNVGKSLGNRLV